MNDRYRRIYEAAQRVLAFIAANLAIFSDVPIVAAMKTELSDTLDALENLGADKVTKTGASRDTSLHRGDARENLRDAMQHVADMWKRIAPKTGGDLNKFRMPRGGDTDIISTAESFAEQLPAVAAEFTSRGFPADFVANLQTDIDAFAQSVGGAEQARIARVGTNAAFDQPVKTCKNLIEDLDPIVKMKFAANPQKLAEWLVASHVERAPKSGVKNPPTTTPTHS